LVPVDGPTKEVSGGGIKSLGKKNLRKKRASEKNPNKGEEELYDLKTISSTP